MKIQTLRDLVILYDVAVTPGVCALRLAKRGVSVVVNDLGSLKNGDVLVECVIKDFGGNDILIDSAGIHRNVPSVNIGDGETLKQSNSE